MEVNKDLKDLLDFYLYSDINDIESIDKFLFEVNIEADILAENLNEFMREKQAELKLSSGRKLKEKYLETLNSWLLNDSENKNYSTIESELISAFRKANNNENEDKDIADDIKKIVLLKNLTRQKKNPDRNE